MIDSTLNFDASLFKAVLDAVSCGVLTTDADLRITSFNRSAELLTGWKASEAMGKRCIDVLNSGMGEGLCPLRQSLMDGKPFGPELLYINDRKGQRIPVRMTAQVIFDANGVMHGAVQSFGDLSTVIALREKLEQSYVFHDIISRNHKMQELFNLLPRIAESSSTVLIRGESGTGKEMFARAIHSLSPRRNMPFVAVNCAALPDTLLEAELFGYIKGAFTDARTDRQGRIAVAEGGTLMLDEVGDLSPALQVKLLRFLQDHQYEPLGSSKTKKADVRIIAATHRDLETLMEQDKYRADFYYRLNVLSFVIPPLRDRLEDIPLLSDHFLKKWAAVSGKEKGKLSPSALQYLMNYRFPGNVRELENIIERASVIIDGGVIEPENLPDQVKRSITKVQGVAEAVRSQQLSPFDIAERDTIRSILVQTEGNRMATAEQLGVSRATLWRKLRKYGLDK